MSQIVLRKFEGGKIFNESFETEIKEKSTFLPGDLVEVFYKSTQLGTAVVIHVLGQFNSVKVKLQYNQRFIANTEMLLQEWWENIKRNCQINQTNL